MNGGGEKSKEGTQAKMTTDIKTGGEKSKRFKDVSRPGGAARLHMSLASTECPKILSDSLVLMTSSLSSSLRIRI